MLQHRLKKLATASPVLAASFGTYTHRCGRPTCRCHHGGPLHRGQHLTFKEGGKTRSVYVPKELLPEVRSWQLNALECAERTAGGAEHSFAWLTGLPAGRKAVGDIAQKGGRYRWKIENEGFSRQKNSGLNLGHVYSTDPENWKAYYLLPQIAFLLTQLLERGSLLRRLAAETGRPFWKLFGGLKNVARRLPDSVRFVAWEESWFDPHPAGQLRIELGSS